MKIKVDETGTFGREVNPNLKPTYNEKYPDVLNNPEWHKFESGVKYYPLSSPQVPLSVVDGELVKAIRVVNSDNDFMGYRIVECDEQYSKCIRHDVYHIPKTIDGFAVGSEIKTDMTGVPLSPVDDYYKEMRKRIGSEVNYECSECGWDIGLLNTGICPKCRGTKTVTSEPQRIEIGCPFDEPETVGESNLYEGSQLELDAECYVMETKHGDMAIFDAYISGYKADKWVSIESDDLPPFEVKTQIICADGEQYIGYYNGADKHGGVWFCDNNDYHYPTHWQLLPSAPKN